jgi:DNA-binding NtrC family response regulator
MRIMPPEPDTSAPPTVLLVDDDEIMRVSLEDRLRMEGFETSAAADFSTARRLLRERGYDLVATDIRLPDGDGRALFEEVCRLHPGIPVILMTGFMSVEDAVALTKAGAADYLTKPFDLDEFIAKTRSAIEKARDLNAAPLIGPDGAAAMPGSGMLGRSAAMRRIEEISARIRDVDSSVLLTGESGAGKEVVANFLHRNSTRASGPFVAVNCAALPLNLVESELFGHEKGAFTGADRRRVGRFELAQGGTIFLDEIAEVPVEIQVKLLRVLQERKIERLGGADPIDIDARVIAATQVDLEVAVAEGRFRADLFWRLNVIRIDVPPLRERPEDILFLARRFVATQAREMGRPVSGISAAAEARLLKLDYPGNVRELHNIVERAVALAAGPQIGERDLFAEWMPTPIPDSTLNLRASVELAERVAILRALVHAGGALQLAAGHLGITRKNLWEKMRRYGIERPNGS